MATLVPLPSVTLSAILFGARDRAIGRSLWHLCVSLRSELAQIALQLPFNATVYFGHLPGQLILLVL